MKDRFLLKNFIRSIGQPQGIARTLLLAEGDAYQLHEPDSWPRQAMLAAQGKWVELEALKESFYEGQVPS